MIADHDGSPVSVGDHLGVEVDQAMLVIGLNQNVVGEHAVLADKYIRIICYNSASIARRVAPDVNARCSPYA
jgi:hypothetical protein